MGNAIYNRWGWRFCSKSHTEDVVEQPPPLVDLARGEYNGYTGNYGYDTESSEEEESVCSFVQQEE